MVRLTVAPLLVTDFTLTTLESMIVPLFVKFGGWVNVPAVMMSRVPLLAKDVTPESCEPLLRINRPLFTIAPLTVNVPPVRSTIPVLLTVKHAIDRAGATHDAADRYVAVNGAVIDECRVRRYRDAVVGRAI